MTISQANPSVSKEERRDLRELARRVAGIVHADATQERIRLWKKHNALQPERPMLLVFPEGGWKDLEAGDDFLRVRSRDPFLREVEWNLRSQIYAYDHFDTDNVVDPDIVVRKVIGDTGWGVEVKRDLSTMEGGAYRFHPTVVTPADLGRLRHPDVTYDEETSLRRLDLARDLFADILPVRFTGVQHVSYHLMNWWTAWHGLEEVMMDMIAEPAFLHDAMEFLTQGHLRLARQWEEQGLLDLNHNNSYQSTGGNGWLEAPPSPDADPEQVKRKDLWASAEAQELTGVSPEMHEEFALQYERRLLEPYALNGYGCCDDLGPKLEDVFRIRNIRRVSISPFADVDRCAPQMGPDYIFSWKPRPTDLVGDFDPDRIAGYVRHTLEVCREHGCVLEMILKDTHTCEGHPERFDAWARIARNELQRIV